MVQPIDEKTLKVLAEAGLALWAEGKEKAAEAAFKIVGALTPWIEDGDNDDPYKADMGFWSLAVYRVDRAYGGPEEGGWWFNYGEPENPDSANPALKTLYFETKQAAYAAREAMDQALEAYNEGRRPISSVLSEGVYQACVNNGPPAIWPARQPHYS